jgi:hypothetical protein
MKAVFSPEEEEEEEEETSCTMLQCTVQSSTVLNVKLQI